MKKEFIEYTCDFCNKKVTIQEHEYERSELHTKWIRLYKLISTTHKEKTKFHFCSDNCGLQFLQNHIKHFGE